MLYNIFLKKNLKKICIIQKLDVYLHMFNNLKKNKMEAIIKVSEESIFIEKENQQSFSPLKEGKGTFIARMDLRKKKGDYIFPNDYYAIYSDASFAYEVIIPDDYKNPF